MPRGISLSLALSGDFEEDDEDRAVAQGSTPQVGVRVWGEPEGELGNPKTYVPEGALDGVYLKWW